MPPTGVPLPSRTAWPASLLKWAFAPAIGAVLLAAAVLVACAAARPAAAQSGAVVSIESQEAAIGDSVGVPVSVSGFGEIGAVSLSITYDPEVLSLPEEADTEDIISGAPRSDFSASQPDPGRIVVSWFDASDPLAGDNLAGGDQVLLELTFSEYRGGEGPVEFGSESEIAGPEGQAYGASYQDGAVESAASEIDVSVRRQFEDPTDPSSYKLVALPGQPEVPLSETVSGREGTDWRGFRELGASGSGEEAALEECASGADENCVFGSGSGFWVIARSDWSFEGTVTGAEEGGGGTTIPLHGGWNLVSNPLRDDLPWADVQAANGLNEKLFRWTSDGTWEEASTMLSAAEGEAYYVFNGADLGSLTLPGTALGSAQAGDSSDLKAPAPSSRQAGAHRGSAHRGSAHRAGAPQGAQSSKAGPRSPGGPAGRRAAYASADQSRLSGQSQLSGQPQLSGQSQPSGQSRLSANGNSIRSSPQEKILEVRAEVAGKQAGSVTVGTAPSLSEPKTYRAPPGHFMEASLRVVSPNGSGPPLARKVLPERTPKRKPKGGQTRRFSLLLKGPPGATARLVASGLEEWASCRVSAAGGEAGPPANGEVDFSTELDSSAELDPSAKLQLPKDGEILLRLHVEAVHTQAN